MEIKRVGTQASGRGLPIGLPAPCVLIHCFKRLNLCWHPPPALRLSPEHAQRGHLVQTLIVTAGAGWVKKEGVPSRAFIRVMSFGLRPVKSTDAAPHPQRP